jgi:hypothetical protein
MPEAMSLLMREFLTWVCSRQRTYAEAMDAWRSNCPRHTVWEDALGDGLIRVEENGSLSESLVTLTSRGRAILASNHLDEIVQRGWSNSSGPGT